jgi:hypothetical protein
MVAAYMVTIFTPAAATLVDKKPGKNMYKKYNKKHSHKKRMRQLQRPKVGYCPPMQVD